MTTATPTHHIPAVLDFMPSPGPLPAILNEPRPKYVNPDANECVQTAGHRHRRDAAAAALMVRSEDLCSRSYEFFAVKRLAQWLLRQPIYGRRLSYPEISACLDLLSHSTVLKQLHDLHEGPTESPAVHRIVQRFIYHLWPSDALPCPELRPFDVTDAFMSLYKGDRLPAYARCWLREGLVDIEHAAMESPTMAKKTPGCELFTDEPDHSLETAPPIAEIIARFGPDEDTAHRWWDLWRQFLRAPATFKDEEIALLKRVRTGKFSPITLENLHKLLRMRSLV